MKIFNKFILVVLLCLNKYVDDTNGTCILHLDKDFGNPSPVLLRNGEFLTPNSKGLVSLRRNEKITAGCPGTNRFLVLGNDTTDFDAVIAAIHLWSYFLTPNSKGQVSLRRYEKITAGCPGTNRFLVLGNDTTDFDAVDAQCKSNKTFLVGRWEGNFKDITCSGQPWTTSEPAGRCYGGINSLHRVGFKVRSKFYPLYEACLNNDLVTTTYVKHHIQPTAKYIQVTGKQRPSFIEGGLFGKVQVDKLYKNKNQRDRLVTVLGEGMDTEYISKKQFLSRGHLAPQGDYTFSAVRRATFHYVNTAPQWFRGNAGDWAALEEALRRRASTLNSTLDVYTGTLDVLTLKNKDGRTTQLYLTDDENNNGIVPVPMYFFKLVYDPRRRLSTAFVTINSQFYNKSTNDGLTFCDDTCGDNQLSWLRWRNDGAHSFCCDYAQFTRKVSFLPPLDVQGELD